jgi:hypothetical protein
MKLIQRITAARSALLLAAVLGVAFAADAVAGDAIDVIIDAGHDLTPAGIQVVPDNGALDVSGRIEKRYDHRGRIRGHVDVQLLDADGRVLAGRSTALTHFSPSRKDPHHAYFQLHLDQVPPAAVAVRVSHRVGAYL